MQRKIDLYDNAVANGQKPGPDGRIHYADADAAGYPFSSPQGDDADAEVTISRLESGNYNVVIREANGVLILLTTNSAEFAKTFAKGYLKQYDEVEVTDIKVG